MAAALLASESRLYPTAYRGYPVFIIWYEQHDFCQTLALETSGILCVKVHEKADGSRIQCQ
jgi:hypothetical protein